ncbi:MAG: prepilin-type N-terminal cleavage/methylation domain-containing protein [Acidobacteria bacterium]|nr:prepilin-type N-terminal cleavage/methylation domain-containing protein [Acidobacteriota bacterium]
MHRPISQLRARHRARRRAGERGFTLLEMIIVVTMIGILATLAIPALIHSPRRAQEAVLKTNLRTIRDVINQFYADKGQYPTSLEALVDEGYLRTVPIDPITKTSDTWQLVYDEVEEGEEPAETDLPEEGEPGIVDVYSGAEGMSLDGTPYSEW